MCGFADADRRRRHRVDEPGADGRQQGRAESGAGRQLSGRLPEHRPGRREPRARVRHLARGAGRVRAAQPSARARGDRRRAASTTRSCRCTVRVARRPAVAATAIDVRHRRRAAPRHLARGAGEAAAGVSRRRHGHRRQLVADQRRRRRGARHVGATARASAAYAARRASSPSPPPASSRSASASARCRRSARC